MDKILLAHGGGGEEMNSLIGGLIFDIFDSEILREANDSAVLKLDSKVCNPQNPIGSCMVSGEGACAAYYKYVKRDR